MSIVVSYDYDKDPVNNTSRERVTYLIEYFQKRSLKTGFLRSYLQYNDIPNPY